MKRATVLAGLVLALAGLLAGQATAGAAAPAATDRLPALDQSILERLNALRTARGLRPLKLSPELQSAAVFQSRSMLEAGFFSHDSRDGSSFVVRLKRFYRTSGFRTWSAGENLLFNSAPISADDAIAAWLSSPPHRENMLDPTWREVGIGSLRASAAGGMFGSEPTWVVTMDFGARLGDPKANRMAAMKAPKPGARAPVEKAVKKVVAKKSTAGTAAEPGKDATPPAGPGPSAAAPPTPQPVLLPDDATAAEDDPPDDVGAIEELPGDDGSTAEDGPDDDDPGGAPGDEV